MIRYTTFSECGNRRNNEDFCQVVAEEDKGRYLFVVCDGMGGHSFGETASEVVCSAICEYWVQASFQNGVEPVLKVAFQLASEALDAKADVLHHAEMGTTMVLAAISDNKLTIAHCGDSRAYVLRQGEGCIYQTDDHIEQSVWGDFINRSFFSYHPEKADMEVRHFDLQIGDRLFLCTDGVSSYIDPDILKQRLMDDKPPEEVADVLEFLCERSSRDNYTGIIVYNE